MSKKEFTEEQIRISRVAKALAHPVRIAILQLLANESCCYHGDMSEIIPVAKSTLSQHLNELKEAGLIQGEFTPPTIKYCINRENWELTREMFSSFIDNITKLLLIEIIDISNPTNKSFKKSTQNKNKTIFNK